MGIGASTATEESQSQVPRSHRGLPQTVPALHLPAGPFASHEFLSQERVPVLGPCVPALFLGKGPSQWEIQSTWRGGETCRQHTGAMASSSLFSFSIRFALLECFVGLPYKFVGLLCKAVGLPCEFADLAHKWRPLLHQGTWHHAEPLQPGWEGSLGSPIPRRLSVV